MDHEMEFDRAYRQYAGLIYRYFSYMFHELYTIGSTTPHRHKAPAAGRHYLRLLL